jgi:nitroimidazol reductase NimA-like FMN-containing flavoprotein (pyridoxamine 5'-phosphate oxidase superfamily)
MSKKRMEEILTSAKVGRLAMAKGDIPYVVPLSFGYANGKIYLHFAKKGKKLDFISKNPRVCFVVDKYFEDAHRWESVIAHGKIRVFDDVEKKEEALKILGRKIQGEAAMKRTGNMPEEVRANMEKRFAGVYVAQIAIEQMTGWACGGCEHCNLV